MKGLLAPGLFLLTLALILWVMGRISARGPRSAIGRYAAFEADENKLMAPIFAVVGAILTGIGVWGYIYG